MTEQSVQIRLQADTLPLLIVHNPRARRYLLRIRPDGTLRVTVPRYGNQAEALSFVERQQAWISQNRPKALARKPPEPSPLVPGSQIWFRGEKVTLSLRTPEKGNSLVFADQCINATTTPGDWKPLLQTHLRKLATIEFSVRVFTLARQHGLEVKRVSIRDQKSRWGSCSARKTISLSWRLIQAPPMVLDYVIVHELMHLKEMNHSRRFWQHVATAFPQHHEAEQWLKQFGKELR
jgi:predicted metal-dependent hydrolase